MNAEIQRYLRRRRKRRNFLIEGSMSELNYFRRNEQKTVDAEKCEHEEKIASDCQSVRNFVDEKKPFVN